MAIRQFEITNPFSPIRLKAIIEQLDGVGYRLSRKTVHCHLNHLIAMDRIVRVERGAYLSTVSTLYREIAHRFIQYDEYHKYQTRAAMDGVDCHDFLHAFNVTCEPSSSVRRANRLIRDGVEEDLDAISDATTLHVLANRVPRVFDTTQLQRAIVTLLYHVLTNYRDDAALLDVEFTPEDCVMTIIITFDPHYGAFKSRVDRLDHKLAAELNERHRRRLNDAYGDRAGRTATNTPRGRKRPSQHKSWVWTKRKSQK